MAGRGRGLEIAGLVVGLLGVMLAGGAFVRRAGRVTDGRTGPVLLGTALLVGGLLVLTGAGLGIAALVMRRRKAPTVTPAPWPTQPVQG
ncbi:hypothetical protein [Streptomyces sp. NPDC047841]|uniref:hypothetical protein n=1 Tax=Streptomyces sp. NPDC047841 TaxID=3154708 RepID=UPI0034529C43